MVESERPTDEEEMSDEYWWNRPWSRRRTLIACFLVGWLGAIAIMAFGDYQLYRRLPTLADVGRYILLGLFLAPMVAGVGWLMSAGARRRLRSGRRDEQ